MKNLALALFSAALFAASVDHPTGNRTTPPTINVVSPRGIARGTTAELTVEGLNLARAGAIYFSEPGVTGRILRVKELPDLPDIRLGSNGTPSTVDLGPLPPRNQVTVEVTVSADADIGPVDFRLQTPLGTSPEGRFLIEPYYGESPDREPNDTFEGAFETYLPTILVGAVAKPGDEDLYKIEVKAGQELVFEDGGAMIGSALRTVVAIVAPDQTVVREFGTDGEEQNYFVHNFEKAGTYYIRVSDYERSGRANNTYRIKVGNFPVATSAWPLGLQRGQTREVTVRGLGFKPGKIQVKGEPSPEDESAVILRPETEEGKSFYRVKLALGDEPELESSGGNTSVAAAQAITLPVTINGRIPSPENGRPVESYFRFKARKGEKLVFEVNARRLGSELDSLVEVVDLKGNQIPFATVRSVWETFTTLAERDSVQRGIRIQAWGSLTVGDYMMIGGEIVRVERLPQGPDSDILVESFNNQRVAYFNTSTEAHGVDKPVYKIQIHPAGAKFSPNGLPLVTLTYRNDDGGPGYGKDSLLEFTAPGDGEYLLRLRDVRGLGGDQFTYRLTARNPRPDFRLAVSPANPNVPRGATIPITATAFRMDGYDGPIEVALEDLPPGLTATKGVIAPGQVSTTLLLTAEPGAELETAAPLKVVGRAKTGSRTLAHMANPEEKLKLISLMPKADVLMQAHTTEVVLEPGGKAEVKVAIQRQNDFGGRVPVEVRNLPPRVFVMDVGLNGVLLNEDENTRTFEIEALPNAEPIEQLIYVSGRVETRSGLQSSFAAPQAILLKVKPKEMRAAKD